MLIVSNATAFLGQIATFGRGPSELHNISSSRKKDGRREGGKGEKNEAANSDDEIKEWEYPNERKPCSKHGATQGKKKNRIKI